jgi:hypothetical protein
MSTRSMLIPAVALALAAAASGCAPMQCPQVVASPAPATPTPAAGPAAGHASKPPEARHVYRLDYVLAPGGSYSMMLEEDRGGEVRVGANVPLQVGGNGVSPRQDVGLNIHASYVTVGDDLLLHTNLEMSSADEATQGPVSIHKLSTASDVFLSPGKPVVVNSIDDGVGHKRYQLTVTATKIR